MVKIINYSTGVRYNLQNTDVTNASSNLLITQDSNGIPTALMAVGEVAVDGTGKNIDFQLIVGTQASIQYVCTGLLEDLNGSGIGLGTYTQRTEKRILEFGIGKTTNYTIDGVDAGYEPSLPIGIPLVLTNTAFIGHPDTVDSINTATDVFKYYSVYGTIL